MPITANETLFLLVLIVLALVNVSSVNTHKARTTSNFQGFVRSRVNGQDFLTPNRLLRVHNTKVRTSEERMINLGASVDDMFSLFKLNNGVEKLLANKNLNDFIRYVDKFNLQNPGNGASAIKSITGAYGDDVVAKTLQLAKKNRETDSMAEKLLSDQRQMWLNNKQSPDSVFKLLKLDDAANNPLNNPNLDVWMSYLHLFNYHTRNQNPVMEQPNMIKTFTAAYGDDALAKMLLVAKEDPATKNIAEKLQVAQFVHWASNKYNPNRVYDTVFKLDPLQGKKIPEPYQTILNQYLAFYKLLRNQK